MWVVKCWSARWRRCATLAGWAAGRPSGRASGVASGWSGAIGHFNRILYSWDHCTATAHLQNYYTPFINWNLTVNNTDVLILFHFYKINVEFIIQQYSEAYVLVAAIGLKAILLIKLTYSVRGRIENCTVGRIICV